MPESVSGVDAILDGLRERATGWSCVPLADAVAAVHAAAGLGSPDERLREAAVIEAVAWSLFPDHPRPMSEAGLDCARRAIDTALFAAADREAPEPRELGDIDTGEGWYQT